MNLIQLPFWMNKGELKKLAAAGQGFWEQVEQWLTLPLSKTDLLTCDLILVDAEAWQRKITRLDGENEMIYRKRVNYAFLNAQDAGMTIGIKRIFARLGIQIYDIKERQPERDWDIVTIELDDTTLSDNRDLVNLLIQTYGATCRRYEYNVSNTIDDLTVFHGEMSWTHQTYVCGFVDIGKATGE